MDNPFKPYPVRIADIVTETSDKALRTFKFEFLNEEDLNAFQYKVGQFAELSIAGKGEIPIGIASSPTEEGYLLFTVNRIGLVTEALHNMKVGDVMGIRGPLGNSYPMEEMKGCNLFIIGGGYAFTTLRSTIIYVLDPANRGDYNNVTVIYGAREPGLLLYKKELEAWQQRDDIDAYFTIDRECEGWEGHVGFVPAIADKFCPACEMTYAIVCGPPPMIRFTQPVLTKAGFPPDRVVLSLENRMKCGFGMCGRCNTGNKYVCKDGPVFTQAQLNVMPKEY